MEWKKHRDVKAQKVESCGREMGEGEEREAVLLCCCGRGETSNSPPNNKRG